MEKDAAGMSAPLQCLMQQAQLLRAGTIAASVGCCRGRGLLEEFQPRHELRVFARERCIACGHLGSLGHELLRLLCHLLRQVIRLLLLRLRACMHRSKHFSPFPFWRLNSAMLVMQ